MGHNWISKLHKSTFQQLINLKELELYGNTLKTLNGNLLASNNHLNKLYIHKLQRIEAIERNFFDNLKLLNTVQSMTTKTIQNLVTLVSWEMFYI